MDNHDKDLFIKNELQKDTLISPKADKQIKELLKGGLMMDQNEENQLQNQQQINQTEQQNNQENVVKLDEKKANKSPKKKRAIAIAASVMILFLATNCFAAALGYNNIFFIIRNLINHEDVFAGGKGAIFTDRDITISYESIEISRGVFVQVNKFVAQDNKANLKVTYQQLEEHDNLTSLVVTDEKDNQIGNYDISNLNNSGYEVTMCDIQLEKYKGNMNVLMLKAMKGSEEVSKIKIDLETRTIDILSNGISYELTKLSEIELKEILGNYVMINYFDDVIINRQTGVPKNEYIDAFMVDMVVSKYGSLNNYEANEALHEIYGRDKAAPINISSSISNIAKYNQSTGKFEGRSDADYPYGYCINIGDIKFENGVYTVTFSYCYLGDDGDIMSNKIMNANLYETTFKFKLNEQYKYYRYQVLDINSITSQLVKEGNYNNIMVEENPHYDNSPTHVHDWAVNRSAAGNYITLDGMHSAYCRKCYEFKNEPHKFEKWYNLHTAISDKCTATDWNSWSLVCKDCGGYVFTTDYEVVRLSGYSFDPIESDPDLINYVRNSEWCIDLERTANSFDGDISSIYGEGIDKNNKLSFISGGRVDVEIGQISNNGVDNYYSDGYSIFINVTSSTTGEKTTHHVSYKKSDDVLVESFGTTSKIIFKRVK